MDTHDPFEMGVVFGSILQKLQDIRDILASTPREDKCSQIEASQDQIEFLINMMVQEYESSEGS
jgi:hypothetical protein